MLIRDGLMVITLGLSMIFLFPNLYLKVGLPITAPLATRRPVLGAVRRS